MAERIDESQLAAWRAFINAHAAVFDRLEREMAAAGQVSLTAYDVLVALLESPQRRARMHALARRLVFSRSGLTRLVDRLEAEGLVARERCGSDRRGAYAVLTEQGLVALRAAWPTYAQGIRAHFLAHLEDAELDLLTRALGRVDAAARQLPAD